MKLNLNEKLEQKYGIQNALNESRDVTFYHIDWENARAGIFKGYNGKLLQ